METAASSCHLIKDSEVDVEHSTLQQVLDSLEGTGIVSAIFIL